MPILDLGRKSPAERTLDEIRQQLGKLDIDVDVDRIMKQLHKLDGNVDVDELRKRLRKLHVPEVDVDRIQRRLRDVRVPEVDTDRLQKRLKDVHVPGRYEEPESSSAGFVAGIAVGVVLGIVLSYLFGKGSGGGAMDAFTQKADELTSSAVETIQHARESGEEKAERVADEAAQALDDDPAIEREIDGEGDTFVEVDQPVLDATDQTPRTT